MVRPSSEGNPVPYEFRPGSQILMDWFDRQNIYHSSRTILDDVDEQSMILAAPIENGIVVGIEPGTEVTLVGRHKPDVIVGVVRVTGTRQGHSPSLQTTLPEYVEKTTHRRYYRVDIDVPVTFKDGTGRILNLSGSGCMLHWDEGTAPEAGHVVPFKVKFPSAPSFMVLSGKVIRVFPSRDKAALDFVRLTRNQQNELIRYVFLRQTELLRMGVLRPESPPTETGQSPDARA